MPAANGSVAPFPERGRDNQASLPHPDSFQSPGGDAAPPAGEARSRSALGERPSGVGPSSGGELGSVKAAGSGGLTAGGPSPGGQRWSAEAGGRGPSARGPLLPGSAKAVGGAPSAGGSCPGGGAKLAEAGGEGPSPDGVPGRAEGRVGHPTLPYPCSGQSPEAGKDGVEELDLTCAHLHSLQGVALPQSLTVGRADALGFCAGLERFPGSVCVSAGC